MCGTLQIWNFLLMFFVVVYLMAASWKDCGVESLLSQIASVYDSVESRKRCCEKICQKCKTLLKPWPKKFAVTAFPGNHANSNVDDANVLKEASLSVAEQEELALLEKALMKAEKTRQRFSQSDKTIESEKPGSFSKKISSQSEADFKRIKSVTEESKSGLPNKFKSNPNLQELPKLETLASKNNPPSNKAVSVITQSKLNSLLSPVNGVRTDGTGKQTTAAGKQAIRAGKQTAATDARYKPAHATAPFKTDVRVRPASKTGQVRASSSRKENERRSVTGSDNIDRNDNPSPNNINCRQIVSKHGDGDCMPETLSVVNDRNSKLLPSGGEPVMRQEPLDAKTSRDALTSNTVIMSSNRNDIRVLEEASVPGTQETPTDFYLQRDGKHLKLPQQLLKAISVNQQLKKKCSNSVSVARGSRIREGESTSDNFMKLLESHLLHETKSDLDERVNDAHRLSSLYDFMASILLSKVPKLNIPDNISWQEAVRSQKILEFVLTEFANLDETYCAQVEELQFRNETPPVSLPVEPRQKSLSNWLPRNIDSDGLSVPRVLRYRRPSQLKSYIALNHKIQLLKLHMYILTEVERSVVSQLESMSTVDSNFFSLFRAAYSLVSSFGQNFPTIVKDVPDDECQQETGDRIAR